MKTSLLVKGVLLAAALPLLAGCAGQAAHREHPAAVEVTDEVPPPPAPQRDVILPLPGSPAQWFWVAGCWEWNERWVWVPGRWASRPYAGAVWSAAHWDGHGKHRVWVTGHWR